MAFSVRNLSVLAYANGFTLWHYKAGNDTKEMVKSPGFFEDARNMLTAGDMMIYSAKDGMGVNGVCTDEAEITLQDI